MDYQKGLNKRKVGQRIVALIATSVLIGMIVGFAIGYMLAMF